MKKIVVTPNITFSPEKNKLVGSIDLSNVTFDNMPLSFDLSTYRLVNLTEVLQEDPWLVEIYPLEDNEISLSIGGEYIGDIKLSELEPLLLRTILM